jgi:hypothetical protein
MNATVIADWRGRTLWTDTLRFGRMSQVEAPADYGFDPGQGLPHAQPRQPLGSWGSGRGLTCWRRLRDWNGAGVWQRLHEVLLAELNAAARLDWSRCVVDSSHVRA